MWVRVDDRPDQGFEGERSEDPGDLLAFDQDDPDTVRYYRIDVGTIEENGRHIHLARYRARTRRMTSAHFAG